jgi:hypothetical protein
MRWQGHVSIPGVSPERERRLTASLPASITQRRDPARYRSHACNFRPWRGRALVRPASQGPSLTDHFEAAAPDAVSIPKAYRMGGLTRRRQPLRCRARDGE